MDSYDKHVFFRADDLANGLLETSSAFQESYEDAIYSAAEKVYETTKQEAIEEGESEEYIDSISVEPGEVSVYMWYAVSSEFANAALEAGEVIVEHEGMYLMGHTSTMSLEAMPLDFMDNLSKPDLTNVQGVVDSHVFVDVSDSVFNLISNEDIETLDVNFTEHIIEAEDHARIDETTGLVRLEDGEEIEFDVKEWYSVSDEMASALKKQGELIVEDTKFGNLFGRQTTMQLLTLDDCIVNAAKELVTDKSMSLDFDQPQANQELTRARSL